MTDGKKPEALAALRWLIDAGADEAVGEHPVDRFAARRPELSSVPPSPVQMERDAGEASRSLLAKNKEMPEQQVPRSIRSPARPAAQSEPDAIGHAHNVAEHCNTLADLKAALEGFDGSQLKQNATNTVFADGNVESRVLFIGEAPGREEDRVGLPFVGVAGKLLDLMLASIGLDRTSAYIINVLPWRPPDNRTPEPTEVALCIPFLRRHIELVQPEIMVLLGAVAVRHVLGLAEGIMRYRGRWMEYRIAGRMVPVMSTLHPAYLLRQPTHKKLAWRDLQAVEQKMANLKLPFRQK
jgi:uracil-DNA glycosylase family 4